jgi:hypothetical protein
MSPWWTSAALTAATTVGSLTLSPEFIPGMASCQVPNWPCLPPAQTDAGSGAGAGCAGTAAGAAPSVLARYSAMVRSRPYLCFIHR